VILLHQIVILLLKITSYNAKHSKIEELDWRINGLARNS
jgi:hypothetical protein